MKQKMLSAVMAICMALMLFPTMAAAEGTATTATDFLTSAVEGKITLKEDVALSEKVEINGNLTIDLAGHTITGSAATNFHVTDGTLTVKDSSNGSTGAIDVSGEAFRVGVKDANDTNVALVIESDVDVKSSNDACVVIYDGTLTTSGNLTSTGAYATITGSGSGGDNTVININGGNVKHTADVAIYHPQVGTLTVNDGTIEGATGIEMRAGTLIVNSGTITATGEFVAPSNNGNGSTVTGAAVAVSQHTTNNPISVTIAGGTLKCTKEGAKALYENDLEDDVTDNVTMSVTNGTFTGAVESVNVTGFISGGTFNSSVATEDLAYGFTVSDGSVSKLPTVAKVGEKEYVSLADAVAANKETTDPVTIYIIGNATWETGAAHGSTPFGMKTTALTIEGVADTNATFIAVGAGIGPVGQESGNVTFKNLTIKDESVSYAENSWEHGYLELRGDIAFDGCTFVNAIQIGQDNGQNTFAKSNFTNCTFNSNKESEYDVWVGHGTAVFTNCTFEGYRGLKIHEAYGSKVASVTVDDCTFSGLTKKPGIAIGTVDADTAIIVKNSTFIDCQPGDQGKYIYESDTDVTTFEFDETNNTITCSVHSLTKTNAIDATCQKDGNIAYWTCSTCPNVFSDAAATTVVTEVVTSKVDCHYLDGKCTMCGAEDPDYKPAEKVEMGTTDTMEETLKDEASNIIDESGNLSENIVVDDDTKANIQEAAQDTSVEIIVEVQVVPVEEESIPTEEAEEIKTELFAVATKLETETEEKVEGVEVVQYLDLSVLVKAENKDTGDKTTLGELQKTKNPITFTITIPEEKQKPGVEFFILRNHNGAVEKLPLTAIGNNQFTFTTDQFSTYALVSVSTHVHTETVINAEGSNCGTEGYTGDVVCSTCNTILQEGSVIKADGNHHWSEWKNQEGIAYTFRECWDCGASEYLNADTTTDAPSADKTVTSTNNPATGDTSNMFVWITLMVVCCGAILGTMVYRKNK